LRRERRIPPAMGPAAARRAPARSGRPPRARGISRRASRDELPLRGLAAEAGAGARLKASAARAGGFCFAVPGAAGRDPPMSAATLLLLLAGLVALVAGAELLVRGAARLATAAGISPLVVGLTVVRSEERRVGEEGRAGCTRVPQQDDER